MTIKRGSHVKQLVPQAGGVVLKKQFNDATDQFQYLVEFAHPEGEPKRRWFDEDQIVAVEPTNLDEGTNTGTEA